MYSIGGASVGLQVGRSSTDFVQAKLGNDASIAAGNSAETQ
jgi:lipid-binding SYLF domain-containing protein